MNMSCSCICISCIIILTTVINGLLLLLLLLLVVLDMSVGVRVLRNKILISRHNPLMYLSMYGGMNVMNVCMLVIMKN